MALFLKTYLTRSCIVVLFILFVSNSVKAQTEPVEPYEYDSILKGGYHISFKMDDSLEYLYLKQKHRIITELSSCSRGLPYKGLGYLAADFTGYFVLVHSFSGGNPTNIELIEKKTGKNILPLSAAWIDDVENKQMLLYCEQDVPSEKDRMILYNVQTGKKEAFPFPKAIFSEPQVLNRISIKSLTATALTISYDSEKGTKTKTYHRS
ncbi:hypothetical protein [Ferruginibacter sp.]